MPALPLVYLKHTTFQVYCSRISLTVGVSKQASKQAASFSQGLEISLCISHKSQSENWISISFSEPLHKIREEKNFNDISSALTLLTLNLFVLHRFNKGQTEIPLHACTHAVVHLQTFSSFISRMYIVLRLNHKQDVPCLHNLRDMMKELLG